MKMWQVTLEICILVLISLGLLVWISNQVQSAPVEFQSVEGLPEKSIIESVFSQYLATRPGIEVQSALIDFNHDGIGEIVARFIHPQSCFSDQLSCRTTILQHETSSERQNWLVKFDSYANVLEILDQKDRGLVHIDVDGLEWKFDQSEFQLVADSNSSVLVMESVPPESVEFIVHAFGFGATALTKADQTVISYSYAFVPTLDDSQLLVLSASGAFACGKLLGCPLRLIRKVANKWDVVLNASYRDTINIRSYHRDGMPDVSFDTPNGLTVFGWSGAQYNLVSQLEQLEETQ